jgi:enterochelin esterase-like enzyme
MGTEDFFTQIFEDDSALLEEKGLSPDKCPVHMIKTYPGGHEWNVWRLCARDFLQLIFKG